MNRRDQQRMQRQFAELCDDQAEITLARRSPTSCHDLFIFYVDSDDHSSRAAMSYCHQPRHIVDRARADDHAIGASLEKLVNVFSCANASADLRLTFRRLENPQNDVSIRSVSRGCIEIDDM